MPLDALTGSHPMLVNDFQILSAGPETGPEDGSVTIDDFKRSFVSVRATPS